MRFCLFLFIFFVAPAWAGFEGITIKNLDLKYERPYGRGVVERASLILSSFIGPLPMPVELVRSDASYKLGTPYFDLVWQNPLHFLHDLKELEAEVFNLNIGSKEHTASASKLAFVPNDFEMFKFQEMAFFCKGDSSSESFKARFMNDCWEKLVFTSKRVEVPTDLPLFGVIEDLPKVVAEIDAPVDDLVINVDKGEFNLVFYFRYFFYAGLRARGHLSYEDDGNTVVLRLDQIKWGYLPVTSKVMNEMKRRIKHPDIVIDPPYMKFKIR